jgi:hypothetical protein
MDKKAIRCLPSETGMNMGMLLQAFTIVFNPGNHFELIRTVTSNILGKDYIIEVNGVTSQLHHTYQEMYGGDDVRLYIDERRYFTLCFADPTCGPPHKILPWPMTIEDELAFPCVVYKRLQSNM